MGLKHIILVCLVAASFAVDMRLRIDCHPDPNPTQDRCLARKCTWDATTSSALINAPKCFFPEGTGYTLDAATGTLEKLVGSVQNPFGLDLTLTFSSSYIGAALNVRITSREGKRFEPEQVIKLPRGKSTSTDKLELQSGNNRGLFTFKVVRSSSKTKIFDTSLGGLLFADQYIQIAAILGSSKIYGFGENIHQTFKHDLSKYKTWGMLARDEGPDSVTAFVPKNLYGVHSFYLGLDGGNQAHGVFILNSNAQEVTLGPGPHLVYRTIGGMLDMFFFPGPTPEQVIQQYLALIGTPFLPAYYTLGYQLSRYGYKSLEEMQAVVEDIRRLEIPLDIPYADIDYMDRYKDFTLGEKWKDFGAHSKTLREEGLRLFLIFDPAIQVSYEAYSRAVAAQASFIEWPTLNEVQHEVQDLYPSTKDTKVMLGVVWPDEHTAFPDFLDTRGNTTKWWTDEFVRFHQEVPFDGIWIDMNEPANFGTNEDHPFYFDRPDHPNITPLKCPANELDKPPYETLSAYYFGGSLATKSTCMNGLAGRGTQTMYDTRNLYGLAETIATQNAMYAATKIRGAIISRSTFPSSGHYAGHWLGDNTATWSDLKTSIIGIQEFNLFGIPYVGADICGFRQDTTEELCLRWQQLGAFYPFSRNHNDIDSKPQHPTVWPKVAAATKQANLFRYKYLPYLFSLHFDVALNGGTVIRPTFFEFMEDGHCQDLSFQFMWGPGMLIIPVYTQGATSVRGYLPHAAVWYSLRDTDYGQDQGVGMVTFQAPTDDLIPVLARGGVIIPRQAPNVTTRDSRTNPFELLIPLRLFDEEKQLSSAEGALYWDDGESIINDFSTHNYFYYEFTFTVDSYMAILTIRREKAAANLAIPPLDVIDILGYPDNFEPSIPTLLVDGQKVDGAVFTYTKEQNRICIQKANLFNLVGAAEMTLTFTNVGGTARPTMAPATDLSSTVPVIDKSTITSATDGATSVEPLTEAPPADKPEPKGAPKQKHAQPVLVLLSIAFHGVRFW